jgi:TonB family protein
MRCIRWAIILLALAPIPCSAQRTTSHDAESDLPAAVPSNPTTVPDPVYHIAGNIQKPVVVQLANPQYSEQARQAKFSGSVEVYCILEKNGTPSHVRVVKGVGMGLDEKAVEAVSQYKFRPAMLHGQPIRVDLYIQVDFHITD